MVVVESLTPCRPRDPLVVARLHAGIVRPVSEHVGGRVDEPGAVEGDDVPAEGSDEPGVEPVVTDDVVTTEGGQEETKEHVKDGVVFSLEREDWILQKVRTINSLSFDPHLRVFPCQKPADMTEKESPV